MCYSGKCRYELGGDSAGDCSIAYGKPIPEDSLCAQMDREMEEHERLKESKEIS